MRIVMFSSGPEANLIQHLLGPDMFNTWTRVLVLCLFAIFGLTSSTRSTRSARPTSPALSEEKYPAAFWRAIEEGYFETDLLGI